MNIKGLQTLTLLDYPGKIAATVFTEGCDFRCPFCHNGSLVLGAGENTDYIEPQEVLELLEKRRGKLTGLCISGGEPLMQDDLADFMSRVKALGYFVKLDTNGSYPDALEALISKGLLDYVAMDVKNSKALYGVTAGITDEGLASEVVRSVERSASILRSSGLPFELRTTVVKELHSLESIQAMGRWLGGPEPFFLQGYVDSGDVIEPGLSALSREDMELLVDALRVYAPNAALRGI